MFGKNKILGIYNANNFGVVDIFNTIQGEGPHAGLPAIFIRFGGCNLACSFCDTEFDEFIYLEEKEILSIVMHLYKNRLHNIAFIDNNEGKNDTENSNINYNNDHNNDFDKKNTYNKINQRDDKDKISKLKNLLFLAKQIDLDSPAKYIVSSTTEKQTDLDFATKQIVSNTTKKQTDLDSPAKYIASSTTEKQTDFIFIKTQEKFSSFTQNQNNFNKYLIVITGGEPTRYNLASLCEALIANNFLVQIETNGLINRKLPPEVQIVFSPKATHKIKGYTAIPAIETLEQALVIKILISSNIDHYQDLPFWLQNGPYTKYLVKTIIQPIDEYDEKINKKNLSLAIKLAFIYNVKLNLQLHKIIEVE